MTKSEVARHSADLTAGEAGGAIVGKKRKGRSDKGMTRGPRRKKGLHDDDEEEDESVPGPSKRRKVSATKGSKSAKSQLPPSNEFVSTEDDEFDE